MNKLLIVEDDKLLNDGLAYSLKKDGYCVSQAFDSKQAEQMLETGPELVILDVNLPDSTGFELCRRIKEKKNIAVIFLTAKGTEQDVICGFKSGGDDYITKPFSVPILKERIKAVLRRAAAEGENIYVLGNVAFDTGKLVLVKNGEEIQLTSTEVKLIKLFIENSGKVLTRAQILERVWDIDGDFVDENTLNVNIRRLRSKLEDDPSNPCIIKTVFGIGYVWGGDR